MTIDTAKELQMNIAKEGLALLVLHPTADVQLHRECISHIGTVWGIPTSDTQDAFCRDFASVSMYTAQECISLEIYPCDSDNELISAK